MTARLEVLDAETGVLRERHDSASYLLLWEEDGAIRVSGTLSAAALVRAAMPHLGKWLPAFGFGAGTKGSK